MKFFIKNPKARSAYRARWADAWAKMLATGAASPEEEESVRLEILKTEAGVSSSNDLTEAGFTKVMLHMGALLGEKESQMRDPERARQIYKIERIAKELRPKNPESYVLGVLDDMGLVRDPAKWRTALRRTDLWKLMLTMVSQQRREARKEEKAQ